MSRVYTFANLSSGERVFLANPYILPAENDNSGYQYFDVYDDEYLENKVGLLGIDATSTVGATWGFAGSVNAHEQVSAVMRLALPLIQLPISFDQLTSDKSGQFPVVKLYSNGAITYDEKDLHIRLPATDTPEGFFKNTVFGGKITDENVRDVLLIHGYLEGLDDTFGDSRFLSIEISSRIWPISPARAAKAYRNLVDDGYLEPLGGITSSGFPSFTRIPSQVRRVIENPTKADETAPKSDESIEKIASYSYIPDQILHALIIAAKAKSYHTGKLEALSREINDSVARENAHSAHALIRSLLDHIAPLYGYNSFGQVANNHKWSETDRKRIKEVNTLFRFDADDSLHNPISSKDTSVDMHSIGLIRKSIIVILDEAAR